MKLYFLNKLSIVNKYLMEHLFKYSVFFTLFNQFLKVSNDTVFCFSLKIKGCVLEFKYY